MLSQASGGLFRVGRLFVFPSYRPEGAAVLSAECSLARIHGWKEKAMSTISQKKLLTAEEFFLLPDPGDGSQQELVRGEIITMPLPGGMHGVSCSKADRKLGVYIDSGPGGTLVCNDAGFITERDPDSVRGPDIS